MDLVTNTGGSDRAVALCSSTHGSAGRLSGREQRHRQHETLERVRRYHICSSCVGAPPEPFLMGLFQGIHRTIVVVSLGRIHPDSMNYQIIVYTSSHGCHSFIPVPRYTPLSLIFLTYCSVRKCAVQGVGVGQILPPSWPACGLRASRV